MTATVLGRRSFLCATVAGGLALAFHTSGAEVKAADVTFHPNAWLMIAPTGIVTVMIARSEMGQGVTTSLPMLVAEALDADWSKVRFALADADPVYGMMLTGGSSSVRKSWDTLSKAGAVARAMLLAAAAKKWKVEVGKCRTKNGVVEHVPTSRTLDYGALTEAASKLDVPTEVTPKEGEPRFVGKKLARLDTPDKTNGKSIFGIDVTVPGMLVARVVRCPTIGGKVKRFDASKTKQVKGVKDVVQIEDRLAVVADGYWPAKLGVDALVVEWERGENAGRTSASISKEFRSLAKTAGIAAWTKGDAQKAIAASKRTLSASYEVPFLAHAPMEPMCCTAHVRADGCEVWAPTQAQTFNHDAVARVTSLPKDKVKIHTTMLGGGFGRKFEEDFVMDAVLVSKAIGAPVKVIWSREDDLMHGTFRPAAYAEISGALDEKGGIAAWRHVAVCPSILARVFPDAMKGGLDDTAVDGATELPYELPNARVEWVRKDVGVPCGFWRSVGNSQNAFFRESFVDELAALAKKDPFEFRRDHLAATSRERRVLELVAAKAGWGAPLPAGKGRGIAVHASFKSHVAMVVDVTMTAGKLHVDRVVAAIDCGKIVNPDIVEAQVEGGVVFALSAALFGEITLDDGVVRQRNFHEYKLVRMNQCPRIEVHVAPNGDAPGGVGEPPVPPLAPALCNAIFAATGTRIRTLPITKQLEIG